MGPDGLLWLVDQSRDAMMRVIPPLGQPPFGYVEYAIPTASSAPQNIVTGPDGNLWFTELTGNKSGA